MAQKMLMELSTDAPERAQIKIDGIPYYLKSREDLGLRQDAEFRGVVAEFSAVQSTGDWQKMASLLDTMGKFAVIDIPDDVLAKLSDTKKLKIVEVFTKEIVENRAPISQPEAALT